MADENVVSGNAYKAWCEYATTRPFQDRVKNPSLAVETIFNKYKEKAQELYDSKQKQKRNLGSTHVNNNKRKAFISLNLKYKPLICSTKKSFF